MKKLISWLMAVTMLASLCTAPAFAQESAVKESAYGFFYVEANGEQVKLSAQSQDKFIQQDGLYFKDLNGNGALDVYEDWRVDTEDRITDLLSQMTLSEKTRQLYCTDIANGYAFSMEPMPDQDIYEQNCPFVPDESDSGSSGYSVWYSINEYGLSHMLEDGNGTPAEQSARHNIFQGMSEQTRLGIPMTILTNRISNSWGGYADAPMAAIGATGDKELLVNLWKAYAAETRSVGYHVTLQPYSVELGSWYGEEPSFVADLASAEVKALNDGGLISCAKHFVARGGDYSFMHSKSPAANLDNWMLPWESVINNGVKWIMTNGYNQGISYDVTVDYDKATMSYLRDTLGYDGVIITDWGPMGNAERNIWDDMGTSDGITVDGVDLNNLTIPERYAWVFNNGVDIFGGIDAYPTPEDGDSIAPVFVEALEQAVEQGLVTEERVDVSARRLLRTKFEQGLFENPYCDIDEVQALCCSESYIAQPWEIVDDDTLAAARNPQVVSMEREVQRKSAVLAKNEDNLLPLSADCKVYVTASTSAVRNAYSKAVAEKCTVVDNMEEADVVIAQLTKLDDAAALTIEDANTMGKKLVAVLSEFDKLDANPIALLEQDDDAVNTFNPTAYVIENADAVFFMDYATTVDHGAGLRGLTYSTEGVVFADLLFGALEPEGMILKEIARDVEMEKSQCKDLAFDKGASDYVRLILEATMLSDVTKPLPNNYGDPLLCYGYGMHYGQQPDFEYSTLVVPMMLMDVTVETAMGPETHTEMANAPIKAGEPLTVRCILFNHGDDGITMVQAYDGDKLLNEKLMAVNNNSWRIVEMDVTFDEPGEHILRVGDLETMIIVQ